MNKTITHSLVGVLMAMLVTSHLLSGCGNHALKPYVQTVDSLKTVVNKLEKDFARIDTVRHRAARDTVRMQMENIERFFLTRGDTMPRHVALKLSDYRFAWKGYKQMDGDLLKLRNELRFTQNQLRTLHTDLKNGVPTEILAKKFVTQEKEVVQRLDVGVNGLTTKLENSYRKYMELKPGITHLADSLNNVPNL